jgi:hypothetical protein
MIRQPIISVPISHGRLRAPITKVHIWLDCRVAVIDIERYSAVHRGTVVALPLCLTVDIGVSYVVVHIHSAQR